MSSTATANDLRTKRDLARTYLGKRSPQLMFVAIAAATVARLVVGRWSALDLVVVAIVLAVNGAFEWMVHLFLLHAPEGSIRMRVFGTSVGHRHHHLNPPDLHWLMLRPVEVIQFLPMLALVAAIFTVPWMWPAGLPLIGPYLTTLVAVFVALAHYEWTHLLVHARYRPSSRLYARLARNHRLHHFRNERYWLGVTSNSGDRILRTLPRSKTDVPLSDTARTLGV
jgi:hypothetical protein